LTAADPPEDNLRVARARLLSNGGLADMAVRELQAAASQEGGTWAPPEMARVYQDGGRYDRGIEIMKRIDAQLFRRRHSRSAASLLGSALPEGLLDRPAQIFRAQWARPLSRRLAHQSGVRVQRRRTFARECRGPDAALPKTGKTVAKQVKLKGYNAPQLYTPAVNLELGTRYFKDMVDKYNGQFEYALAAYNAGSDRVSDWLGRATTAIRKNSSNQSPSPRPANMCRPFCATQTSTASSTETRNGVTLEQPSLFCAAGSDRSRKLRRPTGEPAGWP
jgi:soluble lytic murein transglycosylase